MCSPSPTENKMAEKPETGIGELNKYGNIKKESREPLLISP